MRGSAAAAAESWTKSETRGSAVEVPRVLRERGEEQDRLAGGAETPNGASDVNGPPPWRSESVASTATRCSAGARARARRPRSPPCPPARPPRPWSARRPPWLPPRARIMAPRAGPGRRRPSAGHSATSPSRAAFTIAAARLSAPSFARIAFTWNLAVCSEIPSRAAIALFESPSATSDEHLRLARGEPLGGPLLGWSDPAVGEPRVEDGEPARGGDERRRDRVRRGAAEEDGARARPERLRRARVVGRERDERGRPVRAGPVAAARRAEVPHDGRGRERGGLCRGVGRDRPRRRRRRRSGPRGAPRARRARAGRRRRGGRGADPRGGSNGEVGGARPLMIRHNSVGSRPARPVEFDGGVRIGIANGGIE